MLLDYLSLVRTWALHWISTGHDIDKDNLVVLDFPFQLITNDHAFANIIV